MEDLKYLQVGSSWACIVAMDYDTVVKLMIDGQRYQALKEECEGSPLDSDDWDKSADSLIKLQK
jgi:hypothetical protein